jgi:hypothetical protein
MLWQIYYPHHYIFYDISLCFLSNGRVEWFMKISYNIGPSRLPLNTSPDARSSTPPSTIQIIRLPLEEVLTLTCCFEHCEANWTCKACLDDSALSDALLHFQTEYGLSRSASLLILGSRSLFRQFITSDGRLPKPRMYNIKHSVAQ